MKTRKSRKQETPYQTLRRLVLTSNANNYGGEVPEGYEPGQVGASVELDGINYDCVEVEGGGYVVVAWSSEEGTMGVVGKKDVEWPG